MLRLLIACVLMCAGCASDARTTADAGSPPDAGHDCAAGQYQCSDGVATPCTEDGGLGEPIDCAAEGKTCLPGRGCVACSPGERSCEGGMATYCPEDGSELVRFECDPMQGMVCEPDGCKGACAPPEVTRSYIGCDYYPTVTLNPVWGGSDAEPGFQFAVAVANASNAEASVHITRDGVEVDARTVAVDALEVIALPWVRELKGGDADACQVAPDPGSTRLVKKGAYRLRSDRPVTVYQLSPLRFELDDPPPSCPLPSECNPQQPNDCLSFSNDASLLLPTTTLTGSYSTLAWPATRGTAGFLAITATMDGTRVETLGRGGVAAGAGIDADGNGTARLDRGDVLQIVSAQDGMAGSYLDDLSGMRLRADKPVQVIAGHSCANVPTPGTFACDHLEEGLFPVDVLGDDYLVTFPAALASESPHVVRVAAVEPDTHVQFDPPLHDDVTLQPGDPPLQLDDVTQDFRVSADHAILVAQYMQGQDSVPSGSGDPSMSLMPPTAQFRDQYLFTASQTYDANFINVIAPSGTGVRLDGEPIDSSAFEAVGGSGYSVARVELPSDGPENHRIEGDEPFGLVVYGYGRFTSYMVPGGLDLKQITPPPLL